MLRVVRTLGRIVGVLLLAIPAAGVSAQERTQVGLVPSSRQLPEVFGTRDYTITRISAQGFFPVNSYQPYYSSGSLGRFGPVNTDQHFYAALDVPAGAVIDYIAINNENDGTSNIIFLTLKDRVADGTVYADGTITATPHTTWETDINVTPLGFQNVHSSALMLDVETQVSPNNQYFGEVDVWWRRQVSPPPETATFADVPTTNPYFQYIEALAASGITGGCGGGNYCPDNPVTRAQMAVFLSKALGLHWPL